MLFAYGELNGEQEKKEKALDWAASLPPEKNTVTEGFKKIGIGNVAASESQALLQLQYEYCSKRRCLECAVGNILLRKCASESVSASDLHR
jgi:transposase